MSALVAVGVFVAACSDNDVQALPGFEDDDGSVGATDARVRTDGKASGDDDDDDTAGDCGTAPRVRGNPNGFFCSSFRRDGGPPTDASATSCSNDETCCNGGKVGENFPPGFCASTPRADKGQPTSAACGDQAADFGLTWNSESAYTWECGDKNNCNTGQVCCLYTGAGQTDNANIGPLLDTKVPKTCNAKQAFKHGGTYCADECGETDVKLCSTTDDNCGSKKCTAFRASPGSRDLAYCQ